MMKKLIPIAILASVLAAPVAVLAANSAQSPMPGGMHQTSMMGGMQKQMGDMLSEVDGMMAMTRDKALKARMQKLRDHMAGMNTTLAQSSASGNQMMCGQMMQQGQPATKTPAPGSGENHKAHHPPTSASDDGGV